MKTRTKLLVAAVAAAALLWGFFRVRKGLAARSSAPAAEPVEAADPVVVEYGSRNEYVRQLQEWLYATLGVRLKVDGIYGPETDAALHKLHTATGGDAQLLTPDGDHFFITESQFETLKTKFAQ